MSCLFQSLAYFVQNDDVDLIRQKICNFLALSELGQSDFVLHMMSETSADSSAVPSYVSHMRDSSTWGGAIEIQAFCEVYRYRVRNILLTNHKTVTFVPSDGMYLHEAVITWNGGHYEPQRS